MLQIHLPSSRSLIHRLLMRRGPSTVAGIVIAVVVDAINRMRRGRFRSHIGVEQREGIAPAFTDSNTAPTVALERGVASIRASVLHGVPRSVLTASPALPVLGQESALAATTRGNCHAGQMTGADDVTAAAITQADPVGVASRWREFLYSSQFAEALADKIQASHFANYTPVLVVLW